VRTGPVTVRTTCLALLVATALFGLCASASANHSVVELVSAGTGNFDSQFLGNSKDGSHVFFKSNERFAAADTDSNYDIYERTGGQIRLVSTGPAGGNGNFDPTFLATSDDGTHVFFNTDESLVAADTDNWNDIYDRVGGTTTVLATNTSAGYTPNFGAISPDGARLWFVTNEKLATGDTDIDNDVYERSGAVTTLASTGPGDGDPNLNGQSDFLGTSSDGTHMFFATAQRLTADDTNTAFDVFDRSSGTTKLISTNGAGPAGTTDFGGSSADGSRVFFTTTRPLSSADTDTSADLYEKVGTATNLLSTGPPGGNGSFDVTYRGASTDGTRVFFSTYESLSAQDTNGNPDVYERSSGTTKLVTAGPSGAAGGNFLGVSADGSRVFFLTITALDPTDTDIDTDIYERSGGTSTLVSTGPADGHTGSTMYFKGTSTDGTRVFFETGERLISADIDSSGDVYERFGGETSLISTGPVDDNYGYGYAIYRGASSNGDRVFFDTNNRLLSSDDDAHYFDTYSIALPTTTPYARPKSAASITLQLVPAFNECTAPNSTHGTPLSSPSCDPAVQSSSYLTFNAPDRAAPYNTTANGKGSLVMKLFCTDGAAPPCTAQAGDQQDVSLNLSVADVRCVAALTHCPTAGGFYDGKLLTTMKVRLTDRLTGSSTLTDFPFSFGAQCASGSCNLTSSFDAVIAGLAQEQKRAIWQLSAVEVLDGGTSGDFNRAPPPATGSCPPACATSGRETVFLRQGLYAP
jgi:hypothetical protein